MGYNEDTVQGTMRILYREGFVSSAMQFIKSRGNPIFTAVQYGKFRNCSVSRTVQYEKSRNNPLFRTVI